MTAENRKSAADRISPAACISSCSVPSLIGYSLRDHCVPSDKKTILMDAYDRDGVPYDYMEFPKSNHGMYNDPDMLQKFIDLSLKYAEKYFHTETLNLT